MIVREAPGSVPDQKDKAAREELATTSSYWDMANQAREDRLWQSGYVTG